MSMKRLPWNHEKVVARFWARVEKCPDCDCLLFRGPTTNGWGKIRAWGLPGIPKGIVWAHRYAYALKHGTLTPGSDIHHDHDVCNHRNCVNASHLSSVDHREHGEISKVHQMIDSDPWGMDEYSEPII